LVFSLKLVNFNCRFSLKLSELKTFQTRKDRWSSILLKHFLKSLLLYVILSENNIICTLLYVILSQNNIICTLLYEIICLIFVFFGLNFILKAPLKSEFLSNLKILFFHVKIKSCQMWGKCNLKKQIIFKFENIVDFLETSQSINLWMQKNYF